MTRAAVLAFVLAAAGCVYSGHRIKSFQQADWKDGGLVFRGWEWCNAGRDFDCTKGLPPAEAVEKAAEKLLTSSCPRGWEIVVATAPGLQILVAPPVTPTGTTLTSLPVAGAQGEMLLYRCKP